jgi:hypothetical protein
MTLGALGQTRIGADVDLRAGTAIQFLASAVVAAPAALVTERGHFDGFWQAWTDLGRSVLGLSFGAIVANCRTDRRGH